MSFRYSDFLFMWEELSGKSGRRLMEMIGKRHSRSTLICDSRQRRTLYVPLPFWSSMWAKNSRLRGREAPLESRTDVMQCLLLVSLCIGLCTGACA